MLGALINGYEEQPEYKKSVSHAKAYLHVKGRKKSVYTDRTRDLRRLQEILPQLQTAGHASPFLDRQRTPLVCLQDRTWF